jgi:hypothetical protein
MNEQLRSHPRRTTAATDLSHDLMIRVGIPHDRYTVAFHLETCQMWVLDTTGRDKPCGPYLSSRQAWVAANELNSRATTADKTTTATSATSAHG